MNSRNIVLSFLTVLLCFTQSGYAEGQTKFPTWAKAAIGGTIGGAVMYLLTMLAQTTHDKEFANKDTFLTELELYINSDEFKDQKESGRTFNHYYNGLNQLAQETPGIGVGLMKDFSFAQDDASRNELMAKVSALTATLRKNHEDGRFYSKIIMTTLGVLSGAIIACSDDKGGTSSGSTFFFAPSSSRGSSFWQ